MKYRDMMENLRVTPEMRARILRNLRTGAHAARRPMRARPKWQMLSAAACVALVLAGSIWALQLGRTGAPNALPSAQATLQPSAQATDSAPTDAALLGGYDVVSCTSIEELSQRVGFTVSQPGIFPFEIVHTEYLSCWGELAEIDYSGTDAALCLRVQPGVDDPSGDYERYDSEKTVSAPQGDVLLKGSKSKYRLAVWQAGGCAWSLSSDTPLSEAELIEMIASIPQ